MSRATWAKIRIGDAWEAVGNVVVWSNVLFFVLLIVAIVRFKLGLSTDH